MKWYIKLNLVCAVVFMTGTLASATYLKEIDQDIVLEDLRDEDGRSWFRHYREKKHVKRLLRRVAIEKAAELEDRFIHSAVDIVNHLTEPTGFATIEGDTPYDDRTIDIIGSYFKIAETEYEKATAKYSFNHALKEMRKKASERNLYSLILSVEEAAQAGYYPAVLAYGAMNRYGLFGMHKNIALAEAFFKVAAASSSGMGFGYLAEMRSDHYVLGNKLKKSLLLGDDRLPEMQFLRTATIAGGNMAYEFADIYRGVLKGSLHRAEAAAIGAIAYRTGKVAVDTIEEVAEVSVTALVKGAVAGV